MREKMIVSLVCAVWPILRPELEKLVNDSSSPVDDFVFKLLAYALDGVCGEKKGGK